MFSTKPNLRDGLSASLVLFLALLLIFLPMLAGKQGKTVVITYGDKTETYSLDTPK